MYFAIAGIVFFATLAMMVREGLWSNAILLINMVLSGLVAFGFYMPLTTWVDEQTGGEYTYFLDIVCLWGIFVAVMVVLRALTGALSRTRMRFRNPIDPVGGPLLAVIGGWVMMSITLASLHTAPLDKEALGGGLAHSMNEVENKSAFSSPDLWWLRFCQKMSANDAFGTSEEFSAKFFVETNAQHREKFEKTEGFRVRRQGG